MKTKEGEDFPIIIGSFEAQAIAIELEKMQPSRPLTHDLFKTFSESFNITIKEIIIYNLVEGIFYAKLVCDNNEKEVEIDTRTSDAIALAVRFNCPIYTYEFILSSSGILLEEDVTSENDDEELEIEIADLAKPTESLQSKTIKDLEEELGAAISEEDYELASRIRDEINKRKTILDFLLSILFSTLPL